MTDPSISENHIRTVSTFHELVSTPFQGMINALCWSRELTGDFSEIIQKIAPTENITVIDPVKLREMHLSAQGEFAREILLNDYQLLEDHGALPTINIIKCYDRDEDYPFFPTDVYSFHVDRSPIATDTFLCTYHGASSEIIPNSQVVQKVLVPEIREELKKLYSGDEEGFESFIEEYFFDLHYQLKPNARPFSLGQGHLWRLAIDHPESQVPPSIHRAPEEKSGEYRLLLIC
jgi:hypothetical protein